MLIGDPPPTQGDLHFSFFGIPVRVHPLFWLIGVMLAFPGLQHASGLRSAVEVILPWLAALFVSILIHELGHALAMRFYGYSPFVTLYAMGGFTSYGQLGDFRSRGSRTLSQIIICFAGPCAGFLLAGVVIAAMVGAGRVLNQNVTIPPLLDTFCYHILWISIVWGIVNLMPVYPLDGGQISREILLAISPNRGIHWSLVLSIITATMLAVAALWFRSLFATFFFGYLAYSSYATLQAYSGGRWR